ncbi:uncharacterized protein LOC122038518 [Zingiber officinale]|uniref:uncharacterized protein LOC122038518 n=1 Tax=Zingiber officinale TaxID=94328 RepID=UPI001C4D99CF|nr:uncharacterized protein LOC122038518 [Zingiber officinale]XP_042454242.1 uncharacterized protein LOC122038518 [Zingiber officinale]
MLNNGTVGQERFEGSSEPNLCTTLNHSGNERRGEDGIVSLEVPADSSLPPISLSIIIIPPADEITKPNKNTSKCTTSDGDEMIPGMTSSKKGFLSRSGSYQEQCRVCQQQAEEPLIDLGCRCRGELAKAHRSCIDIWFHTKGSNKCEICQQIAANVPFPESQPSSNSWLWRINSGYLRGQEHERRCFSPLWVAFAILIGGLLLDVLVSVSLGVSALPVNIIIGVLIVLGLGTSFRLAIECCQEQSTRRSLRTTDMTFNSQYHPTV